jgi:uncharacterized protein (DUF58 family)
MPRPDPAALALAARYRLALERVPPRGPSGQRLGRAAGSSLEFHERRPYQPGDDVRHVDWRAVARSDQLVVRLWREEVLARLEILVDVSRSMAIDAQKAQLAVDLVALLAHGARSDGTDVAVIALGAHPRPVSLDELARDGLALDERGSFDEVLVHAGGLQPHVTRGSVCVVVSDFLFPHDPRALVRPLAARSGRFALVQVLAAAEHDPALRGARRLTDCEDERTLDLVLDDGAVTRYRARLANLVDGLATECRRAQGLFVSVVADAELDVVARESLVPAGLLEPR